MVGERFGSENEDAWAWAKHPADWGEAPRGGQNLARAATATAAADAAAAPAAAASPSACWAASSSPSCRSASSPHAASSTAAASHVAPAPRLRAYLSAAEIALRHGRRTRSPPAPAGNQPAPSGPSDARAYHPGLPHELAAAKANFLAQPKHPLARSKTQAKHPHRSRQTLCPRTLISLLHLLLLLLLLPRRRSGGTPPPPGPTAKFRANHPLAKAPARTSPPSAQTSPSS